MTHAYEGKARIVTGIGTSRNQFHQKHDIRNNLKPIIKCQEMSRKLEKFMHVALGELGKEYLVRRKVGGSGNQGLRIGE